MAAGLGVDEDQLTNGASHCHIGKTFGFGADLSVFFLSGPSSATPVTVDGHDPAIAPAPERPLGFLGHLPEVRADHHWIFQALAAVHRDNGDSVFGVVAVGLPFVGWAWFRLETLSSQPVGGTGGIQSQAVNRVLDKACALLEVSEKSAPLRQCCHGFPRQDLGQAAQQTKGGQGIGEISHLLGELIETPVCFCAGKLVGRPLEKG